MRTEIVTMEYYEFHELSGRAKQKAITEVLLNYEPYRRDNQSTYEAVIAKWKVCLEYMGFTDANISWSGFNYQGCGASFESDVDIEKIVNTIIMNGGDFNFEKLEALNLNGLIEIDLEVKRHNNFYCHEHTCHVVPIYDLDPDGKLSNTAYKELETLMDNFLSAVRDLRVTLCDAIYADLDKEHDYFISNEGIIDYIETLDIEFNKEGIPYI